MKKIIHISTIHPRRDTRIFYRECISLKKKGFDVYLLVADGLGNEIISGVKIIDLGLFKGRIKKFIKTYSAILNQVDIIKPCIAHFHDAELMIVGKAIQNRGIITYYDIHENVAAQILDKKHISALLRKTLHCVYRIVEYFLINSFHLILAEDSYKKLYIDKGQSITTVLNLPELNSFENFVIDKRINNGIFYIGGISNERGLDTTIMALKILSKRSVDFFMHFIGLVPKNLQDSLNLDNIGDRVKFYGRMDLLEGYKISRKCKVGLAVLKPITNYKHSYPTKFFEYMSIKLPVITSNFNLYKEVIENYDCGYCIDPFSAQELADKIELLLNDNKTAERMGENGYQAINNKFNWKFEEQKLIKSYYNTLNK